MHSAHLLLQELCACSCRRLTKLRDDVAAGGRHFNARIQTKKQKERILQKGSWVSKVSGEVRKVGQQAVKPLSGDVDAEGAPIGHLGRARADQLHKCENPARKNRRFSRNRRAVVVQRVRKPCEGVWKGKGGCLPGVLVFWSCSRRRGLAMGWTTNRIGHRRTAHALIICSLG